MPFDWIVDNTRGRNHPFTFDSVEDALEVHGRASTERSLWHDADAYVEIWLEKDALAGVIEPITHKYDVSLMVARGYSSLSFLYERCRGNRRQDVSRLHLPPWRLRPERCQRRRKDRGGSCRSSRPMPISHFERLAVTRGTDRGMGPANAALPSKATAVPRTLTAIPASSSTQSSHAGYASWWKTSSSGT